MSFFYSVGHCWTVCTVEIGMLLPSLQRLLKLRKHINVVFRLYICLVRACKYTYMCIPGNIFQKSVDDFVWFMSLFTVWTLYHVTLVITIIMQFVYVMCDSCLLFTKSKNECFLVDYICRLRGNSIPVQVYLIKYNQRFVSDLYNGLLHNLITAFSQVCRLEWYGMLH